MKNLIGKRENEHLEFKRAKDDYSIMGNGGKTRRSVLGYCVALGNEHGGRLILGVKNEMPREITGTSAIQNPEDVKSKIYQNLGIKIEIEEIFDERNNRVIIINIPSRPIGQVLKFYGIPLMRIGEELTEMNDETLKQVLNESKPDWSAGICENATIEDLSSDAILVARENYKKKNPRIIDEIDKWDDEMFLNKAKILIKGKITNTAIILLGKPESSSIISPAVAQITWVLKSEDNQEKDYEHFTCPILLAVDGIYKRIRNLKYRYMQDGSLFPEEIDMYDPYVIREALHNCIAHQDYSLYGRIQVIENESGFLVFTNKGSFLPGSIEAVIQTDSPQEYYKNKFLVDAMVNLNMIDTIGSGIKKMFNLQKERYFPMPSYNFDDAKVTVKIFGKVLDLNYAKALAQNRYLSLNEIMLLDQVQKRKRISKDNMNLLKQKNLVEGRYPNIHISSKIADKTGETVQYLKNKGLDDECCKELIIRCLQMKPGLSRQDINNLLLSKLPEILSARQKRNKITNLLYALSKKEQRIKNVGNNRCPRWEANN